MSSFHAIEVVGRCSETQTWVRHKVCENVNDSIQQRKGSFTFQQSRGVAPVLD